jgi:hypothetical protein
VVGAFVEYQYVGLLHHQLAEQQSGGFSAGENFGTLIAIFTRKEHLAQQAANFFVRRFGVPLVQPLESGRAGLDQGLVILGEISHSGFVSPNHFSTG